MKIFKGNMKFKNACLTLVIINIVMFILQNIIPGLTETLALISKDVFTRPWILVTSMFLHGNSAHLVLNMYALFMFGSLIEARIGTKRFTFIYFLSGIVASFISSFFYTAALGASGAIMGILALVIIFLPKLKVLFFFIIPMTMRTAGIIFAVIEFLGAFGIGFPGIANVAHLVGMGVGLLYGNYLLKKRKIFNKRFIKIITPGARKSSDMSQKEIDNYLKYGRL